MPRLEAHAPHRRRGPGLERGLGRHFLVSAWRVVASTALAQPVPLEQRIQRIVDRPEFAHAIWGMQFTSLDSGRTVFALNETRLFTPGSTTKLVTMGTTMAVLGADHRFTTRVYRTGPIRAGVLEGDLVLLASGDPNLSARLKEDGTLAFTVEGTGLAAMLQESDNRIRALLRDDQKPLFEEFIKKSELFIQSIIK